MPNIRWRIGLFVFLAVGVLQVAVAGFVLARLSAVQTKEVDRLLSELLVDAEMLIAHTEAGRMLHSQAQHHSKWNETFIDVIGPDGQIVARSPNVPPDGLGPETFSEHITTRSGMHYTVWDRVHPRSRKGHVRIRVAEAQLGPDHQFIVRVARTLKPYQKTYWRLREQLAWAMLIVSMFSAGGAAWVARRSLTPIDAMARRAALLGHSLDGEMPRSGSGDELDRLAAVLNQMLYRIRSEMMRVRRFSSDAAHGLRTPLTALRGHLELMLKDAPAAHSPRLELALDVVDELTILVNRLLLLERIESTPFDFGPDAKPIPFDELVRDLVEAIGVLADERNIELQLDLVPLLILGERQPLREAVMNILDNALRHTPAGGWIRISLSTTAEDEVELAIEDSGPGLGPEQLERVFERFYSERDGPPGTGLGLAIAKATVEAHGGSLHAESPSGARFVLRLPRTRPLGP